MRTNASVMRSTTIAVIAKQLVIALRPAEALENKEHISRATYGLTVRPASTIRVIDCEKPRIGFSTALALSAVCGDHFKSSLLAATFSLNQSGLFIPLIPFSGRSSRVLQILRRLFVSPPALTFRKEFGVSLALIFSGARLRIFPASIRCLKSVLLTLFGLWRSGRSSELTTSLAYPLKAAASFTVSREECRRFWLFLMATMAFASFLHSWKIAVFLFVGNETSKFNAEQAA